jgi:acyl-CoA reductase-like NAD-dependent aldehyde dehydrogenase
MACHPTTVRSKLQSLNPATGELLAEFEPAGNAEVEALVARAREVAPEWRQLSVEARARYLFRLKEILYSRREEIAALITREAGKPILESLLAEVTVVLDTLQYFGNHAAQFLSAEHVPHHNLALKFKRGRLEYEPYGVVGIISPSNYPFSIPCSELIPALVAGNTVVLKPSELTPQVGLAIRELLEAAELPPGVANVVLGNGETGRALASAQIDKLIFTGSVATGKKIQVLAAERLLPTVLELGGKDPMIVCADAELGRASSGAVWGAFTNAGQACLSVERLYVVRPVAEEFTRLCVEKTKQLRLGPGEDPTTDVGPLIRERQVQKVEQQVAEAVKQGAEVLAGGRRPQGPASPGALSTGFFYEPTVLARVHHGMRVMREETFGPVLPIMAVEDETEAIALANDSEFGLSASVWTRDLRRGERISRALQAGAVMVNDCASYFGISEAPHGGVKSSGIGRTHARLGLLEMVRVKYLDIDLVPRLPKLWWFGYDPKATRLMRGFTDFLFARGMVRRARGLATMLANLKKRYV